MHNNSFASYICVLSISFLVLACSRPQVESQGLSTGIPDFRKQAESARDHARFADSVAPDRYDVIRYDLKGKFDWTTQKLTAELDVFFRPTLEPLTEVVFDSRVSSVIAVTKTTGEALPFKYDREAGTLSVDVTSLSPTMTKTVSLRVGYEVQAASSQFRSANTALTAVLSRKGDPVQAKVVGTFSEPLGAAYWMPCHNKPSDRAEFSTDFLVNDTESLISNGDLVMDELQADGLRRIQYQTRYSLPTYLMAFAIGDFQKVTKYHGNLPVSVWSRRGLFFNGNSMVDEIIREIKIFENKLVPFPFEKYTLVLLPEFTGGIEHAGITFQGETSSTVSSLYRDVGLTAHELGHQWFGDLVTISSWDDLWIKEGMATLLAEETTRPWEDQQNKGRLFGQKFGVVSGEAVIDPDLAPDDKYTSGPYDRAAWVLTQIRSLLGEEVFWKTLRQVLVDNAFGHISTDRFVSYFASALGPKNTAAVKKAIRAKSAPAFQVKDSQGQSMLSLEDKDGALVAPVSIRILQESGTQVSASFGPEQEPVLIESDSIVAFDLEDRHPLESFDTGTDSFKLKIRPLMVPSNSRELEWFRPQPASVHMSALSAGDLWHFDATEYQSLFNALTSDEARFTATQVACESMNRNPDPNWAPVISAALGRIPLFGLPYRLGGKGLSFCDANLVKQSFKAKFDLIKAQPAIVDEITVSLASMFAAPEVYSTWSGVIEKGVTVRARQTALSVFNKHMAGLGGYSKPVGQGWTSWQAYYRDLLGQTEVGEVLITAIAGIRASKDKEALPALSNLVKNSYQSRVHEGAICAAWNLLEHDKEAFAKFTSDLTVEIVAPEARHVLTSPEECN